MLTTEALYNTELIAAWQKAAKRCNEEGGVSISLLNFNFQ